jgi:hypothetical protein
VREISGKEIVKRYLRDNGFDGLYCDLCCGCEIDDLMPCDSMTDECYPGIKEITKESQWVIVPKKNKRDGYPENLGGCPDI